ncbi:hypothetical protein M422DRAFT_105912, partial [Sphaerobolus stellatus SS14]
LPVELLDKLIGTIENPSDLFSLALVSRSFRKLVIEDHLDYRLIQCSSADTPVWKYLIDHPHLAMPVETV